MRRLYNRVVGRAGRLTIGLVADGSLSLLLAYVLVNLFQAYEHDGPRLVGTLFEVAVALNCVVEFLGMINMNFADNIFSLRAMEIFPVTRTEFFARMLVNDLVGLRLVNYAAPAAVTLYFSHAIPAGSPVIAMVVLPAFYFLATLLYSASAYLYRILKYRYGDDADKIITYSIFVIVVGTSIADKYGLFRVPDAGTFARQVIHLMIGGHAAGV